MPDPDLVLRDEEKAAQEGKHLVTRCDHHWTVQHLKPFRICSDDYETARRWADEFDENCRCTGGLFPWELEELMKQKITVEIVERIPDA